MSVHSGVDASAIRAKVAGDSEYVLSKGRNLDMWVACTLAFGFIGVGTAFTVDPVLAGPFLGIATAIALQVGYRVTRIKAARKRISAAWKSALPIHDLHTPSGESVKFVRFYDDWHGVVVEHKDGERQLLTLDALMDGRGETVVDGGRGEKSLDAARLKRWSNVNWKLEDGRVGSLREVVTFGYSESCDVTMLTLKLTDGSVVSEDIDLLTPVGR